MLYLFNRIIPTSKSVLYSLTTLYGIGRSQSLCLCRHIGINPKTSLANLGGKELHLLIEYINQKIIIEDDLKRQQLIIFQKLLEIKSYRGIRHTYGLPVNGQRTHTNRQTAKKFRNRWIKKIVK